MGSHAKFCKISRKVDVEVMEDMLIVWLQDLMHKRIPLSAAAIREQALTFYNYLTKKSASSSDETFCASRGWFDRFRKRFGLHNVSFVGLFSELIAKRH